MRIINIRKFRMKFSFTGLLILLVCFSVSGDRDYVLQIISRDMESYNEFLNTKILHHSSVRSASSSFALRRVKYTTALPF